MELLATRQQMMNITLIGLSDREQESLLRTIEASLQVKKRYQFFLWTQGHLQALIPHEVLICALTRDGGEILMTDRFSSCVVPDEVFDEVCRPDGGLVAQTLAAWRQGGESPCLMSPDIQMPGALYERFGEALQQARFGNAAAHGSATVGGSSGMAGSFFVFARIPGTLCGRQAWLLELLLPHIHMAFLRTLAYADSASSQGGGWQLRQADIRRLMTGREIEILHWMQEGKSNHEIGMVLGISPLTVKNHVQKILRKLDVRNRAQAVSKATAMRLIGYGGGV